MDRSANVLQATQGHLRLSNHYLFPDKGHDSNPGQNVLARQTLAWDAVGEGLRAVRPRLAQMPHEQRHVGPDKEKHLMVHAGKSDSMARAEEASRSASLTTAEALGNTVGLIYLSLHLLQT